MIPQLPTELWIIIADEISELRTLASLSATCHRLHTTILPLLLHRAASVVLDENRYTVLIWASIHGHLRVVKGLLEAGAAVNALDCSGFSSLMYACQRRYKDIAHCLISCRRML